MTPALLENTFIFGTEYNNTVLSSPVHIAEMHRPIYFLKEKPTFSDFFQLSFLHQMWSVRYTQMHTHTIFFTIFFLRNKTTTKAEQYQQPTEHTQR